MVSLITFITVVFVIRRFGFNVDLYASLIVDVIGQIVEVFHVKVVFVNGKDTQKLSLELRNHE